MLSPSSLKAIPLSKHPPEAEKEGPPNSVETISSGGSVSCPSTYPTPISDPEPPAVPKILISSSSISTTSEIPPASPFLLLPTELILQISSILPPTASCQLSLSCRRFRIIIGPVRLTRKQVYKELLELKISSDYSYHLINFGNKAFKRQSSISGDCAPASLKRQSSENIEQNYSSAKRRVIDWSLPSQTDTSSILTTKNATALHHPHPSPLETIPSKMRREVSAPARLEKDKCLRCIGTCVCSWECTGAGTALFW